MLRFLINIFLVVWLGLLTAATIESHRSVDWSGVMGNGQPQKKQPPQDLLSRMEILALRRNDRLVLSEAEVNRYLARVISGHEHGVAGSAAQFDRVALDFQPGQCRVIFSWKVGGHRTSSATLDFTLNREGENFVVEPHSGSYGRLPVFRGMMCALMPALESLCHSLEEEIGVVFQMNQIRFEQDKVILDPRSEAAK